MYSVEAQTAPRRKARRVDEATAIAISPRPPERPGALAKFRKSVAMYSRKNQYPYQRPADNVSRKHRQRAQPICDVLPAIRGRRPSLPETNSMAGQTCVRNDVEIDKSRRSQRPNNPKPEGRSGETREDNERDEEPSSARWLRDEPFDERSARMKCHWRAFFELPDGCG